MNIEKKRKREIEIVTLMIHLYCQKHQDIDENQLIDYAITKIQKCPRMKEKTFCSQCPIHCYGQIQRVQIQRVMKYSGPRMIFYQPILAIKHALRL